MIRDEDGGRDGCGGEGRNRSCIVGGGAVSRMPRLTLADLAEPQRSHDGCGCMQLMSMLMLWSPLADGCVSCVR